MLWLIILLTLINITAAAAITVQRGRFLKATSHFARLDEMGKLQMESQKLVIWHFHPFGEILTPDQRKKFYSLVSKCFPAKRNGECGLS